MRNIPDLRGALVEKMLDANWSYLAQHGLAGVGLDDEHAINQFEHNHAASAVITFDNTVRHVGALLGGRVYSLLDAHVGYSSGWTGSDFERYIDNHKTEEAIRSNPLILSLLVEEPKREEWKVWLVNDSPPYAVNDKDAAQVNTDPRYLEALQLVRQGFGDEAVPLVTINEVALLTAAIGQTEARILGAFEQHWKADGSPA